MSVQNISNKCTIKCLKKIIATFIFFPHPFFSFCLEPISASWINTLTDFSSPLNSCFMGYGISWKSSFPPSSSPAFKVPTNHHHLSFLSTNTCTITIRYGRDDSVLVYCMLKLILVSEHFVVGCFFFVCFFKLSGSYCNAVNKASNNHSDDDMQYCVVIDIIQFKLLAIFIQHQINLRYTIAISIPC